MDHQSYAYLKKLKVISSKIGKSSLQGDYASAFKGAGLEFDQLREYVPGDDVRTIDWNASARSGDVMVKKFIQERDRTVLLALDVSSSMYYGGSKIELAHTLAGALGFIAHSNHDKVGAVLFSDTIDQWIAPAKGQSHYIALMQKVAAFSTPQSRGTDFSALSRFLLDYKNKRGVIVCIISDWIDQKVAYLKQFTAATNHFDVIAFSVTDPCEKELPAFGLVPLRDSETGQIKLIDTRLAKKKRVGGLFEAWRSTLFKKLRIDYQDFSTDQPWLFSLIKFFHARTRRQI